MRKGLLSLLLFAVAGLSAVHAYDFSVVVPSGQTLYFEITSSTAPYTVKATYPGYNLDYPYNGHTKPTGNLAIPATVTHQGTTYSVTSIGNYAFEDCSGLTSVTIPNSVTSIGQNAFSGCSGLTTLNFNAINCGDFSSSYHPFHNTPISTIDIGDSVQHIPANFAYDLDSLTSVTIGNSVTSIGNYAFRYCSGLTSVTIPNSVTSIGSSAFYNCSGLTSVTIGNSVTSIGSSAFYNCSGLTSVTIGNSVTSIGSSAFYNCSGLTTLNFNAINCTSYTSNAFQGTPISTLNIGDSVQRIPAYFAYDFDSLRMVTIPTNVTIIEGSIFSGCDNLTTVNFNAINYIVPNNSIIFASLPISTLNIGNSVQMISNNFAYFLDSLQSVNIPNSVTYIGDNAFSYCKNISSINFGNSVTHIGDNVFSQCKVSSVIIPSSVTTIGSGVLNDCDSLTTLVIGENVAHIDNGSFYLCSNLHEVVSMATYPPILDGRDFFSTIATLKVPCGTLDEYNTPSISSWNLYFISIQEMCGDVGNNDSTTSSNDTVYITIYDTITLHDTVINTTYDTIAIYDTIFVVDTLWMYDTIYYYDTIYINDPTGIEDVSVINAKIYSSRSRIVVEGANGNNVMLFDMSGRLLATKQDEYSVLEFDVPISGAYFVKIGNYNAKKVVVIK